MYTIGIRLKLINRFFVDRFYVALFSALKLSALKLINRFFVDRFYVALFSALKQTHCA